MGACACALTLRTGDLTLCALCLCLYCTSTPGACALTPVCSISHINLCFHSRYFYVARIDQVLALSGPCAFIRSVPLWHSTVATVALHCGRPGHHVYATVALHCGHPGQRIYATVSLQADVMLLVCPACGALQSQWSSNVRSTSRSCPPIGVVLQSLKSHALFAQVADGIELLDTPERQH